MIHDEIQMEYNYGTTESTMPYAKARVSNTYTVSVTALAQKCCDAIINWRSDDDIPLLPNNKRFCVFFLTGFPSILSFGVMLVLRRIKKCMVPSLLFEVVSLTTQACSNFTHLPRLFLVF